MIIVVGSRNIFKQINCFYKSPNEFSSLCGGFIYDLPGFKKYFTDSILFFTNQYLFGDKSFIIIIKFGGRIVKICFNGKIGSHFTNAITKYSLCRPVGLKIVE